jgi:malate synthase
MVQVYEIHHVKCTIWRVGHDKYAAAVRDKDLVEKLRSFDNQKVALRIRDIVLRTRLNYHEIGGSRYIVFFLPKSLNPTWAKLHSEGKEVDAEVIVPRDEIEVVYS